MLVLVLVLVLVLGSAGQIFMWDTSAHMRLATLSAHREGCAVRALLLLPAAGMLASCAHDGHLLIWDVVTPRPPRRTPALPLVRHAPRAVRPPHRARAPPLPARSPRAP